MLAPRLIEPKRFEDERGFFESCFDESSMSLLNSSTTYVAKSFTSKIYTIRGMHFQAEPFAENKLITVAKGSILDVVINLDVRLTLTSRIHTFLLDDKSPQTLFIPKGFAHGYQTLEENTLVLYGLDGGYHKASTSGFSPLSPGLEGLWQNPVGFIKPEDLEWPALK